MTGIPAAVTTSARQGEVVSAAVARVAHRNADEVTDKDTQTQRAMQKDEKEEGNSRHRQRQRWESAEQQ